MEGDAYTLQRVLFYYISLKGICVCSVVHMNWVNYHQESLQQIMLCLNMPKLNHSGSASWSVNQHWLISCVELILGP